MAEEHLTSRQERPVLWTKIFTAFKLALDAKKLVLAAVGILCTSVSWYALSLAFYSLRTEPAWKDFDNNRPDDWQLFKREHDQWLLLHELAGPRDHVPRRAGPAEVATSLEQYKAMEAFARDEARKEKPVTPKEIQDRINAIADPAQRRVEEAAWQTWEARPYLPAGRMRVLPWFEDRGPNPILLAADVIKRADGAATTPAPWSGRLLLRWFFAEEVPILLEPIVKFFIPIVYLFDHRAGIWEVLYLVLVLLATLAIWGYFGGAITRIAAVQFARGERISLGEALRFAREQCLSFFTAPVIPIAFVGFLTICLIVFGLFELIPVFGDIVVAGLGWPIVLLTGFIMAIVLIGLAGWPLMYATISTEASDSFDALSRSYSYVYQAPWQYLWYSLLAAVYGAVLIFFITFMGSLLVYLGKWGVARTPGMNGFDREPSYLFVAAPTSFGWRDLLLAGGKNVREAQTPHFDRAGLPVVHYEYHGLPLTWYNQVGAFLVSVWLYALFLLMLGFAYSVFWSAATIIYFLMRRHVDDTDLDEVHLEGEEFDEPFAKPVAPPPAAAKPGAVSLNMVEAPRAAPAPVAAPTLPAAPAPAVEPPPLATDAPAEPAPPADGDGARNPVP